MHVYSYTIICREHIPHTAKPVSMTGQCGKPTAPSQRGKNTVRANNGQE